MFVGSFFFTLRLFEYFDFLRLQCGSSSGRPRIFYKGGAKDFGRGESGDNRVEGYCERNDQKYVCFIIVCKLF